MKQKMRERVRPKMGKIDIDYQKLHDAFFRWQIKPKMTIHGDLYYEVGCVIKVVTLFALKPFWKRSFCETFVCFVRGRNLKLGCERRSPAIPQTSYGSRLACLLAL